MKKHLTLIFLSLFIIISTNSFAQADSIKMASTQRQIDKDQKRVDKLERKAKKQDKKQKRHERKMERKEKKMQRSLRDVENGQRRMEKLKKDTSGTGSIQILYPVSPLKNHAEIYTLSRTHHHLFYRKVTA